LVTKDCPFKQTNNPININEHKRKLALKIGLRRTHNRFKHQNSYNYLKIKDNKTNIELNSI
jgi:hypothetical protein